jgi:hypothetical protein
MRRVSVDLSHALRRWVNGDATLSHVLDRLELENDDEEDERSMKRRRDCGRSIGGCRVGEGGGATKYATALRTPRCRSDVPHLQCIMDRHTRASTPARFTRVHPDSPNGNDLVTAVRRRLQFPRPMSAVSSTRGCTCSQVLKPLSPTSMRSHPALVSCVEVIGQLLRARSDVTCNGPKHIQDY